MAAAEGASLKCWAAAAICISATLPAFGLSYLNWFLPLLHKSEIHLLKKQIPFLVLLGRVLPPRHP